MGSSHMREITAVRQNTSDGELDLGSVGRALWRKKLWVILPALIVAVLAAVAVNLMTPRYKSEARILFEGRESVFLRPKAEKTGDRERAVLDQEAVTSQVQLVLSRDLARRVITELKLNEQPEFDSVLRGIGSVRRLLILIGLAKNPLQMTSEERVFEAYFDRLQAYQIEKARVIGIENLWIADASIMPDIVRANTNVASVMIGEAVADRLRGT